MVARAREVLERLEEGIALLEANDDARQAFLFANRAMWQQRVRSVWMEAKKKAPALPLADVDIPKNRSLPLLVVDEENLVHLVDYGLQAIPKRSMTICSVTLFLMSV